MVRQFILNKEQREAVKKYLKTLPMKMPPRVRQVRYKAKDIDFDQMGEDLKMLKHLASLLVPMGRNTKDLKVKMIVRHPEQANLRVKFKVGDKNG